YQEIVESLNKLKSQKIAIDIPTGLDADSGYGKTIFKADCTVTLGEFKKGLFINDGYTNCGKIFKGEIGVDQFYYNKHDVSDFLIEPEDVFDFLPQKKKQSHKYSAGKVLTIAGSGNFPGAAALSAKSVLKVGAGSSILAFPESIRKFIYKKISEVVVHTYYDDGKEYLSENNVDELNDKIKWADVVAIGPGIGREVETQNAVLKILADRKCNKLIIDADAIFALSNKRFEKINLENLVLTPHHGEFANLLGISTDQLKKDLFSYGKDFSTNTGAFLVLKGAPTIIFTPGGDSLINTTGNPGMAKFGTGDVLTGVLAGMLAQQKEIEKAVICGVYIHSLAADLLVKNFTEYTFTAEDIIKNLPKTFKFLRDSFA
ncbi:MAG: NAD(P)H-hydrate dehydratase, partial [Ignavibacteriaceae bacterium]